MEGNLYQSVLHNLSLIPEEYLAQVNTFLSILKEKTEHKAQNRKEILKLAGAWSDMSEKDFEEFLNIAKKSGSSLFDREVEL